MSRQFDGPALQLYRNMADLLHSGSPWRLDFKDVVYPTHTVPAVELKAIALANLKALYDAVQFAGWNTHTSDWDWFVHFTTVDGEEYVSANAPWEFTDKDKQAVEWENVTACVQARSGEIVYIQFLEYHDPPEENVGQVDEEHMTWLPIADIVGVYFDEEH